MNRVGFRASSLMIIRQASESRISIIDGHYFICVDTSILVCRTLDRYLSRCVSAVNITRNDSEHISRWKQAEISTREVKTAIRKNHLL